MKLKTVYLIFLLALVNILFTSRSRGPASVLRADRTGSPLGPGSCQGCHSANAFNAMINIELFDGEEAASSYEPGKKYTLRVTAEADNSASGFGMQAVALSGSDNVNAGDFGDAPAGTQITPLEGRNYFEHNALSTGNVFEIEWTAPAEGTGDVTVYSAVIAANGNGATSGDGTAASSLVLEEAVISSIQNYNTLAQNVSLQNNPVSDELNMTIHADAAMTGNMAIVNLVGQVVTRQSLDLFSGDNQINVPVHHLPKGQYFIQLTVGKMTASKKLLKL